MTKNGQLKKGTSARSPGHLGVMEQLEARQVYTLEVAGSSPVPVILLYSHLFLPLPGGRGFSFTDFRGMMVKKGENCYG